MMGEPLWNDEARVILRTILASHWFRDWKGFVEGYWAFLESPHVAITAVDMAEAGGFYVDQIGAVFRDHPKPGVYLRFRILDPRDLDVSR